MNKRSIWLLWKQGHNTNEIAQRSDLLSEPEVYKIIAACLDAVYMGRPMPWDVAA